MAVRRFSLALIVGSTLALGARGRAEVGPAATLCVNQNPASSCFHSIGAALARAAPGETVTVAAGTYVESLDVHTSITLVGSGRQTTIISSAAPTAAALTVESGSRVTVTGVTVSQGLTGALVTSGASLTLNASRVTGALDNIANRGTLTLTATLIDHATPPSRQTSAGLVNSGVARLTASTVSQNVDIGIENVAGTLALTQSAVISNTFFGIYIPGGTVTLDGASSVRGNRLANCFVVGGVLQGRC